MLVKVDTKLTDAQRNKFIKWWDGAVVTEENIDDPKGQRPLGGVASVRSTE